MKSALRSMLGTLALIALPRCAGSGLSGSPQGDLGHTEFSYVGDDWDCTLGCSLGMPLLLGSSQHVLVVPASPATNATLPALTVETTDPTVLTAVVYENVSQGLTLNVTGTGSGEAKLQLLTAGGALYDSVTVRVEPAASLALASGTQAIDLAVGQATSFQVAVLDADGKGLAAWGAAAVSVGNPGIATIGHDLGGQTLTGASSGTTTLAMTLGSLQSSVPVTVH